MGSVYLAIDGRFDSEVAIKETHFTDETLRKQFEREARSEQTSPPGDDESD